jgi:hypothetical protein
MAAPCLRLRFRAPVFIVCVRRMGRRAPRLPGSRLGSSSPTPQPAPQGVPTAVEIEARVGLTFPHAGGLDTRRSRTLPTLERIKCSHRRSMRLLTFCLQYVLHPFSLLLMCSRYLGWRWSTEHDLSKGSSRPTQFGLFPVVFSWFRLVILSDFRSWRRTTRTISGDTLQTKQR